VDKSFNPKNHESKHTNFIKRQKTSAERSTDSYVKSYKLWRTLWKILGVLLLTTMITLIVIFAEIIQSPYAYWFGIWSEVGIWALAAGFEFHSIGENIEKRCGTKPEIFEFWDKVLTMLQKKALKKIDDCIPDFDEDDEDPVKINDIEVNDHLDIKILKSTLATKKIV